MTGALTPDGLRLLEAQLVRMRALIFRYYDAFFRFIGGGLVATGILFVASFWGPTQAAALLLPFVVLYVGFHATYLFSYVVFGRTFAAAIERRINRHLGADLLVAHRLEEAWFGGPGDPKIGAASLRRPLTFLAAETWHFAVVGSAMFVVGILLGNVTVQRIGEPWTTLYVPLVIGWGLLNAAYLAWHSIGRRDQRAIEAILDEAYGPASPQDG